MKVKEQIPWIPETLISKIIARTSPLDACRLAAVGRAWRSAADCDMVWERFLPADYRTIISRAENPVKYSSMKSLFFRLSESILLKDGHRRFSLKRSSGKVSVLHGGEAIVLEQVEDENETMWDPIPTSELSSEKWRELGLEGEPPAAFRFEKVFLLRNSSSLLIMGLAVQRLLSPDTFYAARLIFRNTVNSFGLQFPVTAGVTQRMICCHRRVCIHSEMTRQWRRGQLHPSTFMKLYPLHEDPVFRVEVANVREDGWMELEIGRFYNDYRPGVEENKEYEPEGQTSVSIKGITGILKYGLVLEGVELWPLN